MTEEKYERYISSITLPNDDQIYGIKDEDAREEISNLTDKITAAVHYRGVMRGPEITDGSVWDSPRQIQLSDGSSFTPKNGDIIIYSPLIDGEEGEPQTQKEYIFKQNGDTPGVGTWNEFGSTSALKGLAFKDSVSTTITPSGKIRGWVPLTGTASTITGTFTPEGNINFSTNSVEKEVSLSYDIPNEITLSSTRTIEDLPANYTPEGVVTASFQGTPGNFDVSARNVEGPAGAYVPAGTISPPNLKVLLDTESVKVIKTQMTLPNWTWSVNESDKNLIINYSQGSLPTLETKTFATSTEADVTKPENEFFTFNGQPVKLSASYTPSGEITNLNFTGTPTYLSGTLVTTTQTSTAKIGVSEINSINFQGTNSTFTASFTPEGYIESIPEESNHFFTFEGQEATITAN